MTEVFQRAERIPLDFLNYVRLIGLRYGFRNKERYSPSITVDIGSRAMLENIFLKLYLIWIFKKG